MKALEDVMILGDARAVIRRVGEEEALSPQAWKRLGRSGRNDEHRHLLDVARARVRTGDATGGMEELVRLYHVAPNWLRHQHMAGDTWEEITRKRKRTLPPEMREVGRHLGVLG